MVDLTMELRVKQALMFIKAGTEQKELDDLLGALGGACLPLVTRVWRASNLTSYDRLKLRSRGLTATI